MKDKKYKEAIDLQLFRRDYDLLAEHHPQLLEEIEKAVTDRVSPDDIRRWVASKVDESLIVQRCYNAARYCEVR